jgi:hypothetical protein
MRPVAVVMPGVLVQDLPQVLFAGDQQVALAAQCSDESLGKRVRPRRSDRGLDYPCAVPGEDVIERRSELAVPVADQEREARLYRFKTSRMAFELGFMSSATRPGSTR